MPASQATFQPYNGWANYETWCVNLWLTNTAEAYTATQKLLAHATDEGRAAQALRAYFENKNPLLRTPSVYADLLNAALQRVEWAEVVEALQDN
jgi:hypothetical protein